MSRENVEDHLEMDRQIKNLAHELARQCNGHNMEVVLNSLLRLLSFVVSQGHDDDFVNEVAEMLREEAMCRIEEDRAGLN